MTEEIIIDGVDVSGCKHYKIGTCVADYLLTDMNFSEAKCKLCPNCYYKQLQRLKTENERLKEEKSKLLSKCLDKQCRINELQQICAIKEFSLKVNGKEYKNLSGIDKAKLFINSENAVRDRYIQKLENKMSDLQWNFYENCKKVVDAQKQIDNYRQALQEIREELEEDITCESRECGCDDYEECLNCLKETILTKINEVIGEK